jgi:transposase
VAAAKKIKLSRAKTRRRQLFTKGGRPPKDDRLMLTGIWFVLRTGLPWRDLPECFGPWGSVYTRLRRWCASGLFARMLKVLGRRACGGLRHLDCSHIKLHQHGANPVGGQEAQAMGRTKGGLNTKLSALVDRHGRAVALSLAPGPQHDQHAALPVLRGLKGRCIVADKGFDSNIFRRKLRRRHAAPCIPPRKGRRQPARFHRGYYRARHHIENFFGRIKAYRRVSTRYEKLAATFLFFVSFAAILDWLTLKV